MPKYHLLVNNLKMLYCTLQCTGGNNITFMIFNCKSGCDVTFSKNNIIVLFSFFYQTTLTTQSLYIVSSMLFYLHPVNVKTFYIYIFKVTGFFRLDYYERFFKFTNQVNSYDHQSFFRFFPRISTLG